MINTDNSKISCKSSSKHCISKVSHTTKYFAKCSVFLDKFISRQFLILLEVFYTAVTKDLNNACTHTEMKQNLLHSFFFFFVKTFLSFVQLLNVNLDEYSLFLSHLKSVSFNDDEE